MEITKDDLFDAIEKIAKTAKKSKLKEETLKKVETEIQLLSKFLDCTKNQALLFGIIFKIYFKEGEVQVPDLSAFLQVSPTGVLKHLEEIYSLRSKRIITLSNYVFGATLGINVPRTTLDGIAQADQSLFGNQEFHEDSISLLAEMKKLYDDRDDGSITYKGLKKRVKNLIDRNTQLDFVTRVNNLELYRDEKLLLLRLCTELIRGSETINFKYYCNNILTDLKKGFRFKMDFQNGNSRLLIRGIAKWDEGVFRQYEYLSLTNKGIVLVMGDEEADLFLENKKQKQLIYYDTLEKQSLYFNQEEQEKVNFVQELMAENEMSNVQQRLKKESLPKGVTLLFHGPPGTGKTCLTYQLGRQTERNIMPVDLSKTRSKWFGESEKKVKEIFEDYQLISEGEEKTPILLLNEADALLSQRRHTFRGSIHQTENRIQNILLEELEDFDGILVATTNLVNTLDKAFDRRFLFKIYFREPSVSVRRKIWKDKLTKMPEKEIEQLSRQYSFTGGQIENISRKIVMHRALNGEKPPFAKIQEWCEEERFAQKSGSRAIGFSLRKNGVEKR